MILNERMMKGKNKRMRKYSEEKKSKIYPIILVFFASISYKVLLKRSTNSFVCGWYAAKNLYYTLAGHKENSTFC
jgi:hypothetical protein